MTPEDLFARTAKGQCPELLLLRGDNPYLIREWKKLALKAGFEIDERELKKSGPDGSVEDSAAGMSLFQTKKLLWLRAISFPNAWSSAGMAAFKRLAAQVDGHGLCVVVQADADKRIKWDHLGFKEIVDLKVEPAAAMPWIKRMNGLRDGFLDAERLRFLAALDADLMTLDNWIEIWSSGGDLWAERSLNWKAGGNQNVSLANPVFSWVDAVLAGRKRDSTKLLKKILEQGEEPLQLTALLAKSVRILALLESGRVPKGQPEFLISKLRGLKNSLKPGHAKRLLRLTAEVDRQLKSTPVKAATLLTRL